MMRRRVWIWLILFCPWPVAAALPVTPQIVEKPEPRWVRAAQVEVDAPRSADGDLDVTYLLVDTQILVPAAGPASVYRRFVYRIETRSALEEWSSWKIELDPSYQQLQMHHVSVLRGGQWEDRLAASRSSLLHREDDLDRQVFDQRRDLVLIFDDIRPGDVVSIAYSRVGQNPVFGGHFVGSESLAWGRSIHHRRLRVTSSAARALHYKVLGTQAAPHEESQGGWRIWTWDDTAVEAIEYTSSVPAGHVQYPFVQFSEFAAWGDVVAWALPLYTRALGRAPPARLQELATQLKAQYELPEDRLVAARNWVQENIRYFGVMLGEHSHAPHDSHEIMRRHYGDCKDKTILLVELLGLLDIEAFPAFVNTTLDQAIADRLPSPAVFDHAIVVAQLGERQIWIDPTLDFQGGNLREGELCIPDYGLALPIRPGNQALQAIPAEQSHQGVTRAVYSYDLQEEGEPWTVRVETTFERHQAEEMRGVLDSTAPEDLLETYAEHYATEVLKLEPLAPLGVIDDREDNVLMTTEVYRVTYEAVDDDDSTILETLPLLLSNDLQQPMLDAPRTLPFALAQRPARNERVVLDLPDDISLEPITVDETNPWFRFAVSSRDLDAGRLAPGRTGIELEYELEVRSKAVAADDLESYSEAVQGVWDNLGYSIWTDGLLGAELRTYVYWGVAAAGLAILLLLTACLVALLRWKVI